MIVGEWCILPRSESVMMGEARVTATAARAVAHDQMDDFILSLEFEGKG